MSDEVYTPAQWKEQVEGLDHTRQPERFAKPKAEQPSTSVTVGGFFSTPAPTVLDTETAAKLREWTESD